jgi:hypothetical protein
MDTSKVLVPVCVSQKCHGFQPQTYNNHGIWHVRAAQGLKHFESSQLLLTLMKFTRFLSSEDESFEASPEFPAGHPARLLSLTPKLGTRAGDR